MTWKTRILLLLTVPLAVGCAKNTMTVMEQRADGLDEFAVVLLDC